MTDEHAELRELAGLLEDEYAHAILLQTSTRAMSAAELSDACDASVSTIYRRLERLQEHDLVAEQLQLDGEGHHYRMYRARLDRIEIALEDGEFDLEVTYRPADPADRFTDLFEGLR